MNRANHQADDWGLVASGPVRSPLSDKVGPAGSAGFGEGGGHASPESALSSAFNPQAILRVKWLVFGVFLLISALMIPCVWLVVKPTYSAIATVRVSPVAEPIVEDVEIKRTGSLYKSYLNTQVNVLRSPHLLNRVLDRKDVQQTSWYTTPPSDWRTMLGATPPQHVNRLRDILTVTPLRDTELINVSITTLKPQDAKLLADALVNEYSNLSDDEQQMINRTRLDTLDMMMAQTKNTIQSVENMMYSASNKIGTMDAEQLRTQLSLQLTELELELAQLKRKHAVAKAQVEQATGDAEGDGSADAETDDDPNLEQRYALDTEWRALHRVLEEKRHTLERTKQQFGLAHPQIELLASDVAHAEFMQAQREDQLEHQWENSSFTSGAEGEVLPGFTAAGLEKVISLQQTEIDLMEEQVAEKRAEVKRVGDTARLLAQYERDVRQQQSLFHTYDMRKEALETEKKAPARISVASLALLPDSPSSDRRIMLTLMALFGAAGAGVALGVVRMQLDNRIHAIQDVRPLVHVPFLGHLPMLTNPNNLDDDIGPTPTERMRIIRTALMERLERRRSNTILITSSSSRAGKTTFSILLSKSLAQLGKKVLLVEADLRNPCVTKRIVVDQNAGLIELLGGKTTDAEAISRTRHPGFDVLPAMSDSSQFHAELIANGLLEACIERWKQSYDFVILDSPPILPVADSRILAGRADGTVMVLRSSHCRRGQVHQAFHDLAAAGGKLIGTVLVGVKDSQLGYGYYGYSGEYPTLAAVERPALPSDSSS